MSRPKIIIIAGPTASGKSALAMQTARLKNGTIINADAMQIYSGLPILSAQPGADQQKEIPHELYAALEPDQKSSAGVWQRLAVKAIDKAIAAKRVPILVGGTGLYFRALLGGLAEIPDVPSEVRDRVEDSYKKFGEEKFRAELAKYDPLSANRIERNDRQRLIRALEVFEHTGTALSEWQKSKSNECDYETEVHILNPGRDKLYAACDARFIQMIDRGALMEAKLFMDRQLDPDLPAMKTLSLRELAAHLRGEMSLDEAISKAQQATRNYAKRQMTWFRNQKI